MKHYPQRESAAGFFGREEEMNVRACVECAERNGHTAEEAEECEDGSLACTGCPWGPNRDTPVALSDVPLGFRFTAELGGHPIVRDADGTLRFKANPLVRWLCDQIDLNKMWLAFGQGAFSETAFMQFYRDIGYSLGGFEEVWGETLDKIEAMLGGKKP